MNRLAELNRIIAEKTAQLFENQRQMNLLKDKPICPREVIVIPMSGNINFWLVVRNQIDNDDILLLVPVDDYFLIGSTDCQLEHSLVARCGLSVWVYAKMLGKPNRLCVISEENNNKVKKILHLMATGKHQAINDDVDSLNEYREWMALVSQASENIVNFDDCCDGRA